MKKLISALFGMLILFSCYKTDPEVINLLNQIKSQNDSLKIQITTLQKRTDSLQLVLKTTNTTVTNIDKKVDSLKTQLTLVLQQINTLNTQITLANTNIADLQVKIAELQKKCTELYDLLNNYLNTLPSASLKNGLILYFPFSGNTGDSSGNNLNGTSNGATLTTDRFGNSNKAYAFDGTNEITVPNNSSLNLTGDMSVSLWFNSYGPPNFRTAHTFITKRSSTEFGNFPYLFGINYQVGIASDFKKLLFTCAKANSYGTAQSDNNITNETWNHVIYNISGNTLNIYLNGNLFANLTIDNTKRTTNNAPLQIGSGGRSDKPAEQMVGKLDDIRIYNRTLTITEIEFLSKN